MSLRFRRVLTIVVCVFSVVSIACGGDPPDKEIQQAEAAIAAAQAAEADKYAADEFKAAQDALSHARQAVVDRDYRLALNHALDSRERAQNATTQAATTAVDMRSRAEAAITSATAAVKAASSRLREGEAANAPPRTVSVVRDAVTAAEANVQKARAAFDEKDFTAAMAAARAVSEQLAGIAEDIDGLPSATRRRR